MDLIQPGYLVILLTCLDSNAIITIVNIRIGNSNAFSFTGIPAIAVVWLWKKYEMRIDHNNKKNQDIYHWFAMYSVYIIDINVIKLHVLGTMHIKVPIGWID